MLDAQAEPEVTVGLPRNRSPPGVCPVSPGQQVYSVLSGPLYLSHLPNSKNTWRVPLRGGQAGPVGGQLKVNPPTKPMILWAEPPVGGTWEPSTLAEDGATAGWSGRGLCQPTL